MILANIAPVIAPKMIGMAKRNALFQSINFLREKLMTAVVFCNNTAIRLVPLATLGGSPKNIKTEREINVPPPANVLMKPTNNPEMIKTMK